MESLLDHPNLFVMNSTKTYPTTCCYCGVGCGVLVHKATNGTMTVAGDPSHQSSKGMLCSKGMNLHYTVMDKSDRLLHPEMRLHRSQPRQRVTWDAAFERVATVFKALIEKYGPDSVGFYVSGQCLTEEYYVVNKLIKGFIGSNNIDTNSRLCMSSAVVGYKLSLGEDSVPVCYDDIELCDVLLVAGANPAWCHPILWRRVEVHKAKNPNVKIIVIDPRRTQTADICDLHLPIFAGTDVTLLHAIARILIEEDNINHEFITKNIDGYDALKAKVFEKTIEAAASICGISVADIQLAASWIGNATAFLSMWTMGFNQSVIGVNKNLSLINLHLLTGQIGRKGSGPFSLTGQPNAMGGREVGGLSNLLPAHRDLQNAAHRKEVEDFWGGTTISPKPGLTATEMFDALEDGKLKAIWVICTNPLVSLPDANRVEAALKKAKFVVVQDISNRSDTLEYADVILPAAAWSEKEGAMTNAERRITYLPKINDAPAEALPDVEILCRFAQKMGFKAAFDYENTEKIFLEHAALTKNTSLDITGVTYNLLKKLRSVQYPFPEGATEGTPRLFTDHQFYTPNQKAKLHAVPDDNHSEKLTNDFPLILTTGRVRDQWHTMTKTGRVQKLNQHTPIPFLEIHPEDAKARLLKEGDLAIISGNRGTAQAMVKVTNAIREGMVFLPMHWGKILQKNFARTNNLTNTLLDPRSKEPDFKFSAVQVAKFQKKKEKIIIIGAGTAAWAFIQNYRKLNEVDEIHVFSKEKSLFYNRILLPEYISNHQTWSQLNRGSESDILTLNIQTHPENAVTKIDTTKKIIYDTYNHIHYYDKLIIATGSASFLPSGVPKLSGIFTIRTRENAEAVQKIAQNAQHAVVVGGSLLALEMADALHQLGIKVTMVHRSSRLMDKQLDVLASSLLAESIRERGITILFNEEIRTFYGLERVKQVMLKSNTMLPCDMVIFGVGTRPVISLAQHAGIACRRGVTVNEYLMTSDPNTFALGEIAEYNGQIWGIAAAAEQQAAVCAQFLNGNQLQYYKGTTSMNILKVEGVQVLSIGMSEIPYLNSDEYEEILFIDRAQKYYKKCIIHRDKLVGAVLIGDKNEFLEFKQLIENGTELSEKRLQLLRAGKQNAPMLGKAVCACAGVGEGNIELAIEQGNTSFEAVCQLTGAGSGCGSCKSEVQKLVEMVHLV
jgi:ferredoxin-nitrate reductase